jgi:hypothetical protein
MKRSGNNLNLFQTNFAQMMRQPLGAVFDIRGVLGLRANGGETDESS